MAQAESTGRSSQLYAHGVVEEAEEWRPRAARCGQGCIAQEWGQRKEESLLSAAAKALKEALCLIREAASRLGQKGVT